ncbi:PAS domain-containing protein [Algibacter sp. L1A34]|uniref:PAS domain-containing protein n=1 Tax=Algibacter sp. L1A34 TaxID=2686365 RepID=UPI00131ABAEA|nr:PAS domain-containing protein [Algibacter sp. L1A34]
MNYLQKELYSSLKTDLKIIEFVQSNSLDGMWYWDLENPENEWMNDRFWEVLGYNPDEMPHKTSAWQNIINQDDLKIAVANFNDHVEDPTIPYDQVLRYTHKNGRTIWIRSKGLALRNKEG